MIKNTNLIVLNMSFAFINPFKTELFELFIFPRKNIKSIDIEIIINIPIKFAIYINYKYYYILHNNNSLFIL